MKKDNYIKVVKDDFDIYMGEYDDYFEDKIIYRGIDIFKNGNLENVTQDNNKYKCKVNGTKKYNVSIEFDEDKIKKMSCTCPYFKDGNNCKHIYALLYKVKVEDDLNLIYEETKNNLNLLNTKLDISKRYIDKNRKKFANNALYEYDYLYGFYKRQIEIITNFLENNKTLSTYSVMYVRSKNDLKTFEEKYEKVLDSKQKEIVIYKTPVKRQTRKKSSRGLFGQILLGVVGGIIEGSTKSNSSRGFFSNDEMSHLSKSEKEMVRKGYYEPWELDIEDEKVDNEWFNEDGSDR